MRNERDDVRQVAEELGAAVANAFELLVRRLGYGAQSSPEGWMCTAEAAEYVGVSDETVRDWAARGDVTAGRDGAGRLRFKPSELDAFLQRGARGKRRLATGSQSGGRLIELMREVSDG